jgi:hypothetical protein
MRVLLVSANRAEVSMRTLPLGLLSVASAIRQDGHAVQVVLDLMDAGDPFTALAAAIDGFRPQVIGIYITLQ